MTNNCCEEHERYKSFLNASKYVVGLPEDVNIHHDKDSPAYRLFSMTYRARNNWAVDVCTNDKGEKFVHIGDFIEWAWRHGFKIQEGIVEACRECLSAKFLDDFRLSLIEQEIGEIKKQNVMILMEKDGEIIRLLH